MPADDDATDLTEPTTGPLPGSGTTDGLAAEVESLAADGPPIAPGGWRRILLGLLVGVAAGAVLALVLPRRREGPPTEPEPEPGGDHGTDH